MAEKDYLVYDMDSETSILQYTKKLVKLKLSFNDMIHMQKEYSKLNELPNGIKPFVKNDGTGALGLALEECYYGIKNNGRQEPDFPKAGIELKSSPLDRVSNRLKPGERVSITSLDINSEVPDNFYDSPVWHKLEKLLIVFYHRNREIKRWDNQVEDYVYYQPTEYDKAQMERDYAYIVSRIKNGTFDTISESDTEFLGVCTKGQNKKSNYRDQVRYNGENKAQKRAFCLKKEFVELLFDTYVKKKEYESIVKDEADKTSTVEEIILRRASQYIGKADKELFEKFGIEKKEEDDDSLTNAKSAYSLAAFRMLGMKSNQAQELKKAGIYVKAIRVENDGDIKENLSLPTFKFPELVKETVWDESTLYSQVAGQKYAFFIFRKYGDAYIFKGVQMWKMPYKDFSKVKRVWNKTKRQIKNNEIGLPLTKEGLPKNKNGEYLPIPNNFTKESDNMVVHVRPHTGGRYYKFVQDTESIGNNPSYGDEVSEGVFMTKQSFWINSSYLKRQLDKSIVGSIKRKKKKTSTK